ncbi:hypothetical protein RRG08_063211 [Elysia crispata]|uniref:Cytochrome P450 n=1 Tax=Elysia crispata TaxID=231223 RepID=A0AAE0YB31_9GAST|nr:hypothetical protein RRG08_063211 [Elysia crispata]
MKSKTLNLCVQEMLGDFCDKFIKLARKDGDQNMPNCFIAEYWREMQERKNGSKNTTLDETNLRWVLLQLFFAGTDTTSSTIMWFMYYMLNHPDIQEKVYQEILREVGTGRTPGLQDKPQLRYTQASIMETQRLASIVPSSVPHYCAADVTLQGYTIPAGTTVLPNLDSVMMDENTWEKPLQFSPDRFLDEKGNIIKHEAFMPFSVAFGRGVHVFLCGWVQLC